MNSLNQVVKLPTRKQLQPYVVIVQKNNEIERLAFAERGDARAFIEEMRQAGYQTWLGEIQCFVKGECA